MKKLGSTYTAPLETVLKDEEHCNVIASFMDPLPKKKLKTFDYQNAADKKQISPDSKNETGEDDLACDEDVLYFFYFL